MSRIFLSHSSADEREAIALKQWLTDNGWDDVFLDLDPERGLAAGERWQEALRKAADRCEAVVFVVSPAWAKSKWCLAEFLLAKSLHKLVFGVLLKHVPIHDLPGEMTNEWQLCHLVGNGSTETIRFLYKEKDDELPFLAEGLRRLKDGLKKAGLSADFFPWPPPNDPGRSPYRGLEPLDSPDAAIYFGRNVETLRGLDALRAMRASGDKQIFVILGPSGTGKSSFLRAGLLPRIKRDDRHFYSLPVIRPSRHPLSGETGFAQAIAGARKHLSLGSINPGAIRDSLTQNPGALSPLLTEIREAALVRVNPGIGSATQSSLPPTLLLPIDQAEELFNSDAGDEARTLLNLIGTQLRSDAAEAILGNTPLIVLFTIRSDRYEPLQTAAQLQGIKCHVFDDLKPMPPDRFREVITGPARRASVSGSKLEIKPDLVDELVAECAKGGDPLPLLGLTLSRLYQDYGQDGDLRLDEYHAMGGLPSVVKNEVDAALSNDPVKRAEDLAILRSALIPTLVTINPDNGEPMRRVDNFDALPPNSHCLLDALADRRLLLTDQRDGRKIIEIAHDAILRQWDALRDWLQDERDNLIQCDNVERAARAWEGAQKKALSQNDVDDDWLLSGERLTNAETLLTRPGYEKRLEKYQIFLAASRNQEDRRQELEESRKQKLRRILVILALLTVAAFLSALYAFAAKLRADDNFREATILRVATEGSALTAGATVGGSLRGFLQVIAAFRLTDTEHPETRKTTSTAINEELHRATKLLALAEIPETSGKAVLSNDGKRIYFVTSDHELRIWDTDNETFIKPPIKGYIHDVKPSPDGKRIIVSSFEHVYQADIATATLIGKPVKASSILVNAIAYSKDGQKFVAAGNYSFSEGSSETYTSRDTYLLQIFNATTGNPIGKQLEGHSEAAISVAFSPDGRYLVSGSSDNTLRLWNADTGAPIGNPLKGHGGAVTALAVSPDGSRIVSGSTDRTLRLWDARRREPIGDSFEGHSERITCVAFSSDGRRIASGSDDTTVRIWDSTTGKQIGKSLTGHTDSISDLLVSPHGTRVMSISLDKTLRIWDTATRTPILKPLTGHRGSIESVAISPDSSRIVSSSWDRTLRLWDPSTGEPIGRPLEGHEPVVTSVAFSADGHLIVSGSADGKLHLWNAATGTMIGGPRVGHTAGVTSVAFSPTEKIIASGSLNGEIFLWDTNNQFPIGSLPVKNGRKASVAFSPDGLNIVSTDGEEFHLIWDVHARTLVRDAIKGEIKFAHPHIYSPDGRYIGGWLVRTLRLWNAKSGEPITSAIHGHSGSIESVAFSPDGKVIVSGSEDSDLRLWEVPSGAPVGEPYVGHTKSVTSVAFSPDGRYIVSGDRNNTLLIWDGSTDLNFGDFLLEKRRKSVLRAVPAFPEADTSSDKNRMGDMPSYGADALCAKLPRNMKRAEWRQWVSPNIDYILQCPNLPAPTD